MTFNWLKLAQVISTTQSSIKQIKKPITGASTKRKMRPAQMAAMRVRVRSNLVPVRCATLTAIIFRYLA